MRVQLIFLLILSSVCGSFAQNLKIDGTVRKSENKEACDFANIRLQTQDSTFVQGINCDQNGRFSINQISPGNYQLLITYLGYVTQLIEISHLTTDLSLDDILLEKNTIELGEVVVSSSTNYSDKKLIFPTAHQIEVSNNGIGLLQQLRLPRIVINPLFDEVSVMGGGEIQFRINGAKVELNDIKALTPSEIIRVEYYDNPGLRYENAEVVLNYIVCRPTSGGNFGVDLGSSFDPRIKSDNSIYAKINYKKSEWSLNYSIKHRNFNEVYHDNEELYRFADGSTLNRIEENEAGKITTIRQYLNLTYSFVDADKRVSKATFRLSNENYPHRNYSGYLYNTMDRSDKVHMIDNTTQRYTNPSIDLYHQENLSENDVLVFNLVATQNDNKFGHFYQEKNDKDDIITDVNSRMSGKRNSLIGEAIYEKKIDSKTLSFGLRHSQFDRINTYRDKLDSETNMKEAMTYAYAEFKGKIDKLDYTLGIGATRSWMRQDGYGSKTNYNFNPRFSLQYNISDNSHLRLRANISNQNPSLTDMSGVTQKVDALQATRGNPNLKSFNKYNFTLMYDIKKGIFSGDLWTSCSYQPKAIMQEKFWEKDLIIQTWDNQKSWQQMMAGTTIGIAPIKDALQINMTGIMCHFISHGNTYKHSLTNFYTSVEVIANYRKFMLTFGMNTPFKWLQGETIQSGENPHYLMLQYKIKNVSIGVNAYNPFFNNFKTILQEKSYYASLWRQNYINETSRLFLANFTYNFSFGRSFKSASKKVNNEHSESD